MTRDDLSSKYKEDCDRLRKERNTAQHELVKVNREREELANRLRSETESLKLEVDKTRNEKSELGVLYKAQLNKDAEKIKQLEKQNEILQKRYVLNEKHKFLYEVLILITHMVCHNLKRNFQCM